MASTVTADHDTPHSLHHDCYACGDRADGIGLRFQPDGDGVTAEWFCDKRYRSYPGIIHGGITATILDAAMTNCLLAKGIVAVTAELTVRYCNPLKIGTRAVVKAAITHTRPPLFQVGAEVLQDGSVVARAHGKFMLSDSWPEKDDV